MLRERVYRAIVAVGGIAFLLFWFINPAFSKDEVTQGLIKSLISHALGSVVFISLMFFLRYRIWSRFSAKHLIVLLPALAVAVNNFPIIGLATGDAWITRWDLLPLAVLDCILIGVFEEFAFRGTLFLAILEKHRKTKKQVVLTTLVSSALFGLVHLANLLEGAGFLPTLMQVGYSFLIGGMCTIVLLKTGNLIYSILLHAVYDLGGNLLQIGGGARWDTVTVILTVLIGLVVSAVMIAVLLKIDPMETEKFYKMKEGKISDEHDQN